MGSLHPLLRLHAIQVAPARQRYEQETGTPVQSLPVTGAFAQFFISYEPLCVLVPSRILYQTIQVPTSLPTNITWEPNWYVAAQPLGTIVHAANKLQPVLGKTVAVIGQVYVLH